MMRCRILFTKLICKCCVCLCRVLRSVEYPWLEYSYDCAVNIEDLIKLSDVMMEHSLGPNGGEHSLFWFLAHTDFSFKRFYHTKEILSFSRFGFSFSAFKEFGKLLVNYKRVLKDSSCFSFLFIYAAVTFFFYFLVLICLSCNF